MISVIIVNYGSGLLTKRAVESVLGEDAAAEIFVVDNTATEDERLSLRSNLRKNVHLILNEKNEGFGRACNIAYSQSKGDLIFLLNPDSYLLPGSLKILKGLMADARIGAAGPRIYWDDERHFVLPPNYLPSPFYELLFSHRCRVPGLTRLCANNWRRRTIKTMNSDMPMRQPCLSGGSVLVRRSAVEKAGGLFDESFFLYYEDADFFRRLRKAGFRLFLDGRAGVVHNYNQSPDEGVSKTGHLVRSHYIYMEKYFRRAYPLVRYLNRKIPGLDRGATGMVDLGMTEKPLHIRVPRNTRDGWAFEWSHNPNLFPAAVMMGQGEEFRFPAGAWSLFKPGKYYGRISNPNAFFVTPPNFSWTIP